MSDSSALTLEQVLEYLIRNNIDDPHIYDYLTASVDQKQIEGWIGEIDEINARVKPAGMSLKAWEGEKNRLKGKCFEQLGGLVLKTVKPFKSWDRVNTPINEIDWLVSIGPTALHLPAMRDWGTHFICECKLGEQTVSVSWLGKLNTVLRTHGATVGLLMSSKGISKKGRASAVRFHLQMYAAMTPSIVIMCLNTAEIKSSLAERKFLQLITQRFIEAKAGAAALRAIA